MGLSRYWSFLLVLGNLALIMSVTLFPYRFMARDRLNLIRQLHISLNPTGDIYDVISNIVLFLGLGLGVARILNPRFARKQTILIFSLILSTSVSLMVEILQMFLPQRNPSILDLACNIFGGIIGSAIFYLWQSFSPQLSKLRYLAQRWLTKTKLTYTALGYGAFVFCLIFSIQRTNNFSNWDRSFPLVVGNEATGDRPWHGTISQIYVANHYLSATEVARVLSPEQAENPTIPWLSAYQLQGRGTYRDRQGTSPDLEWSKNPADDSSDALSMTQQNWLLTKKPVIQMIEAIRRTSKFSILTTVATADTHQTGPARIISISADPFRRNLTIGQEGARLVVRLRTPLSGAGTTNTNLAFPGIFADTNRHQLLLNFDHGTLQLFVDRPERVSTLSLSPAILFFHFLPAIGLRNFQVTPLNTWILRSLFYGLIFFFPATLLVFLRCKLPHKS